MLARSNGLTKGNGLAKGNGLTSLTKKQRVDKGPKGPMRALYGPILWPYIGPYFGSYFPFAGFPLRAPIGVPFCLGPRVFPISSLGPYFVHK